MLNQKLISVVGSVGLILLSSASYADLTPAQKMTALDTFQSINFGTAAADSLNSNMIPGVIGSDALSQKFVAMNAALISSGCLGSTVEGVQPISEEDYSIQGPGCVLSYEDHKQYAPNGQGSFSTRYQSIDPGYLLLNDVDSIGLNYNSAFFAGQDPSEYGITLHGTGSVHSQLFGALPLTVDGSGYAEAQGHGTHSIQITFQIQFADFTAQLQEVSTTTEGVQANIYYLNGASLTSDEVSAYVKFPFAPQPDPNSFLMTL